MEITFTKMHGCGNDFIMIDHRDGRLDTVELKPLIKSMCKRRFGVGADGLMLLENSKHADFKMRYYNADGSAGEMCGNGARCIARFALVNNIAGREMTFETSDGDYQAVVHTNEKISIYFPAVKRQDIQLQKKIAVHNEETTCHHGIVGVPHTVIYESDAPSIDNTTFENRGREIREHPAFPFGTNVNIVEVTGQQSFTIRTYERGVEAETLACGSGACASAIMTMLLGKGTAPFQVQTMGGTLAVDFHVTPEWITGISLTGHAGSVFEGKWSLP